MKTILAEYRDSQRGLRDEIVDIMWYMRGGVTREEAWTLSPIERRDIQRMVEKRMETVEKTGLPLL